MAEIPGMEEELDTQVQRARHWFNLIKVNVNHIQRVINFKSEYRNTKQIQISNAQMIEEPRSKLRGMFCRAAVLHIDRMEFCLI